MAIVEIGDLPSTALPNMLHELAAQKDGLTVKLRVNQIYDLILAQLVVGAPTTLDTLNELAAALGDDPNFAVTMTNALALKGAKLSDTFTTPILNSPTLNKPTINDPMGLFQKGHIFGCITSNDAGDMTNDIRVGPGECTSVNSPYYLMKSTVKQTKRVDALWASGDGNGGLDQGAVGNSTYHFHRIFDPTNNLTDHIFSLSHDEEMAATMTIASPAVVTATDHGLTVGSPIKFSTAGALPTGVVAGTQYYIIAAGYTANAFQFSLTNGGAAVNSSGSQSGIHTLLPGPKMPTGYVGFRRLMSIRRVAGVNELYFQDEDIFTRVNAGTDRNALNVFSDVLHTLSVPFGVKVFPFGTVILGCSTSGNVSFSIGSPSLNDANMLVCQTASNAGGGALTAAPFPPIFLTNRSAQLLFSYTDTVPNGTLNIEATYGWVDPRGRKRS